MDNNSMYNGVCGGAHESRLEECKEVIESKDINSFHYNGFGYSLTAKKEDDGIKIVATGGSGSTKRDGTYFRINYVTKNDAILKGLQKIIDDNNVVKNNGFCRHVDGLPGGIGDLIHVEYESGEKLYKTSNQFPTIIPPVAQDFYDLFHDIVVSDGYDFTSAGSNVQLYDDADVDYVQGKWTGKHFGSEIVATFKDNNVKIEVDGKVTDEGEYTIFEGTIVPNKLKEGKDKAEDYHDYEFFKGLSVMSKKNWFTMTAYFMEESYSTCDLMNFDKPKEEE